MMSARSPECALLPRVVYRNANATPRFAFGKPSRYVNAPNELKFVRRVSANMAGWFAESKPTSWALPCRISDRGAKRRKKS
jgi:hypothetical protein